jgi:phage-related protein
VTDLGKLDRQEQRDVRAALDQQQREQDEAAEQFVTPDDEFGTGLGEIDAGGE